MSVFLGSFARSAALAVAVVAALTVGGGESTRAESAEPVPEADAVVIAREREAFTADAYGGYVVWSAWNPKLRRYRLVARRAGRTVALPVRSSRFIFDVSLGPDRRGRTVAVYSRCRRRDCDLFEFRFATRTERKLAGLSSRGVSEFGPSVWRDRVAFVRRPSRGRGAVRIVVAGPGRRVRTYRGGLRGQGPTGVRQLRLRGDRLAFDWTTQVRDCPGVARDPDEKIDPDPAERTEIHVVDEGGRRRLDAGCDTGTTRYVGSVTNGARGVGYVRIADQGESRPRREYTRVQVRRTAAEGVEPTVGDRSSRPLETGFVPLSVADDGAYVYTVEDRAGDRQARRRWALVRRPTAP